MLFFFFTDTATTEIYTLSLHDALPIYDRPQQNVTQLRFRVPFPCQLGWISLPTLQSSLDRKSTRLNSSHANISYAVFCLKKKKRVKDLSRETQRLREIWHTSTDADTEQ